MGLVLELVARTSCLIFGIPWREAGGFDSVDVEK